MKKHELLRQIPALDLLLRMGWVEELKAKYTERAITDAIRKVLADLRQDILQAETLDTELVELFSKLRGLESEEEREQSYCLLMGDRLNRVLEQNEAFIFRPVINATGVILHTNLGRAPLGDLAARHVYESLVSYNNLEYDLAKGQRGVRYQALEPLLCKLTGQESALVVNNNAAAVLLALNELAEGKEVVVSRGELVEIGGSFRVPDVMKKANCRLAEVGTTNKTHPADYEAAINESTGALMKIHQSNFRITGFSEEVEAKDLQEIAARHGLPLIYDLGSGLLHPEAKRILPEESSVQDAVKSGADIICFSGDKLLGGPQAGIIVGKKQYIDRLKKNPYTRAFRIDKMVVAALEVVLRSYLDPDRLDLDLPIFAFLNKPLSELESRSDVFIDKLAAQGVEAKLVATRGEIGGGSAPGQDFPSCAVSLDPSQINSTASQIEARLRRQNPPIVCCIRQDCLLFDLRCVSPSEEADLCRSLLEIFAD